MNQEQFFGSAVVISGPSGVGKSTVLKTLQVVMNSDALHFSVSCTTRNKRHDEINGMSYYFITDDKYDSLLAQNQFLEHAEVHGFMYGTLKSELEYAKEGKDILLDIDVQGMRQVKQNLADDSFFAPRLVTVFLMPPSMKELECRLRGRKTEAEDVILRRLSNAAREVQAWREYDYVIINEDSTESAHSLAAIINASHCRTTRLTEETWNYEER